jgi:predicted peroxiredoxin
MASKAVVNLATGMEDPEKVTVAFLVAVGAAETGHQTLMFLTKEAVRVAVTGTAVGTACEGCPPLADLVKRYEAAGGRYYICPICFNAKHLDADHSFPAPCSTAPFPCGSGSATNRPPRSATDPPRRAPLRVSLSANVRARPGGPDTSTRRRIRGHHLHIKQFRMPRKAEGAIMVSTVDLLVRVRGNGSQRPDPGTSCLSSQSRHRSAISRQPLSMVSECPRLGTLTISVTAELRRWRL